MRRPKITVSRVVIFTLEFGGGKLTVSWLRDGFGCPRGVFLGCMDPTVYAVSVWGVVDCYKKRFTILTTVPTVLCTGTVPRMGWGAAVPGQAGVCVDKGLRALSIKMKACLTREEHALLIG